MSKTGIARLFQKIRQCNNDSNIWAMLLPSVIGILVCAFCLAGGTWAWFTATQSAQMQPIRAARYTVSTSVRAEDGTVQSATGGAFSLEKGSYTVILEANGDAATGYCVVEIGNTKKYTQQFPSASYSGKNVTFTLVLNEAARVEVTPCWGTSAASNSQRIVNGGTVTYGEASDSEINPPAADQEQPEEPEEESVPEETTAIETETADSETGPEIP